MTNPNYENMIISVKDEKRLAREKEAEEIAQIMIGNINRHLEEKERKALENEHAQDSSPKDARSSSDTSAKES